jgi:urease alpha subunit
MRFSRLLIGCAAFATAIGTAAQPSAQRPGYDLVITNGGIVDGTGAPWFRGDVAIAGDRIAAVGAVGDTEDPTRYAVGVKHVFVNGRRSVADGAITAERPGRPLRGPGSR